MEKPDYGKRLLEIHGSGMWSGFHISRAVEFAKEFDMTGIVIHCPDLLDRIIKPTKYFEKKEAMRFYKNREGNLKNYQYYFDSICDRVTSAGLELYVEVKELNCAQELLSKYNTLRDQNGIICPTNPFWWVFLEDKISEFVERFPLVSGVIVSAGTRESLVSFADNRCSCERCRNYDINQWYRELLSAMFRPLNKGGKKLIVRDFAYTAGHQYAMVEAAKEVSPDVIMALKNVPHDFYPTFPDNPTVGNCNGLEQWIEFDTWGQFFGLGVFPCSIVEDMKRRMTKYSQLGATGVILRTDWERLFQSSTFNSMSIVNLIAGAMLGKNVNTTEEEIYNRWFEFGMLSPLIPDSFEQKTIPVTDPHTKEVLKKLVKFTWQFLEKTIYIRGHVFNRNTELFDMYYLTYYIMTVHHTRDHWEPGASLKVQPMDENIPVIFEEKDKAVEMADEVHDWLRPDELQVSADVKKYLEFLIKAFPVFAREMRIEARAAVLTKRALDDKSKEWKARALSELADVEAVAAAADEIIKNHCYTNCVVYTMDGDRLRRFKDSVIAELESID